MGIALKALVSRKSASKLKQNQNSFIQLHLEISDNINTMLSALFILILNQNRPVLELLLPIFQHDIQFCNDMLQFCGVL